MLDGIDGVHRFQNILDGVVLRVFAGLNRQAFMAHVLQRDNLGANLVLGELSARNLTILRVVGAIQAPVHAVIRQIQRSEQHDAIAIICLLNVMRELFNSIVDALVFAGQKHARLAMRNHGAVLVRRMQMRLALLENVVAQLQVVFVRVGIRQRLLNFLVVDEFVSA